MKLLLAFAALIGAAAPALGQNVALTSEIFVERSVQDAQGKIQTILEAPKMVTPGDKLLFVLSYKNGGTQPAADFLINNPIPEAVRFEGTDSADALLSVDGGKTWGALAALKVQEPNGAARAARADDVTHVKWQFNRPIPAGGEGKVRFRGIVE